MSEGAEKQAGGQVEAGGAAAPVAVAPAKPSRWWQWTKWLTLLGIIGLLVWWWMPETFPIRITVELEYQGQPIVISRVNRCVAWWQGHGIGGGSAKYWGERYGGMGTKLPDGSAVFMGTPNACAYIDLDERKSKRIKYGEETVQPVPGFIPTIAWTPNAEKIDSFELYYLKEAVTKPDSRIIYKGTRVERLRYHPFPASDDGFAWFNGVDELTSHLGTSNFLAFFLVEIPEEEIKKYPAIVEYINSLKADSVLPWQMYKEMVETHKKISDNNALFSHAFLPVLPRDLHRYFSYSGISNSPPVGLYREGNYGGDKYRDNNRFNDIDKIISLRSENGYLSAQNKKGVLFYNKNINFSQSESDNTHTLLYSDLSMSINMYSGLIYSKNSNTLYIFMTHRLFVCTPGTTCYFRQR